MAEIRRFRDLTLRQVIDFDFAPRESTGGRPASFCAYNQTGQRFISNEVKVVIASVDSFDDWLSNLSPGSAVAVWITPIRALSASSIRFPVDLPYLDESGAVVEAVQSFPIARISSSARRAASKSDCLIGKMAANPTSMPSNTEEARFAPDPYAAIAKRSETRC